MGGILKLCYPETYTKVVIYPEAVMWIFKNPEARRHWKRRRYTSQGKILQQS